MKRVILAAILSAFSSMSLADNLYLGAISKHYDGNEYNETHKLVMYENSSTGMIAGYFDNSYNEDTFFAGYKHRLDKFSNVDWTTSGIVAASYGYRSCVEGIDDSSKNVCPMMGLQVDYDGYEYFTPSVVATPVFVAVTGAVKF